MKITALVENTSCKPEIGFEHGLSLYIETKEKTILFDTGASPLLAKNAKELAIDLGKVDLVILSHGHRDHGGGIETFLELNSKAPIYMRRSALEPYYSQREGAENRFIGIDENLIKNNRVMFTGKETPLGKGLTLFSNVKGEKFYPTGNKSLLKKSETGFEEDDFTHEQNLAIEEDGVSLLVSGCSHRGIVNIVEHFHTLFGHYPTHVIGGFHLYDHSTGKPESPQTLQAIAQALLATGALYYTCHCTGSENYAALHTLMKEKIAYLSGGTELEFTKKQ